MLALDSINPFTEKNFPQNDSSQIVQKDIPRYRVAGRKPKRNKVEIEKILYLLFLSPSFFFLCILHWQEDASKLKWDKKKLKESDINNQ